MSIRTIKSTETPIIDLTPTTGPKGRTIWTFSQNHDVSSSEITVRPDGTIGRDDANSPISTIPTERMSAEGNWDRIVRSMQEAEAGRIPRDEIVVQPGGTLVPVTRGITGPQLSKMPEERMAARRATVHDVEEAQRLDPENREGWTFIEDPVIPGFRFHMTAVARRFVFFTFRSPSHSGQWFLSPLSPRYDDLIGHEHHMIPLQISGDQVPVVCVNNRTSAHPSLAMVRGTAGKFCAYHDFRGNGHVPFSA